MKVTVEPSELYQQNQLTTELLGVSKNWGTPKWMVYWKIPLKWMIWWVEFSYIPNILKLMTGVWHS